MNPDPHEIPGVLSQALLRLGLELNSSSSTSAAGDSHFWVKLLCSLSAEGTTDTGPTQPSHTGTSQGQIVLARHDEAFLFSTHSVDRNPGN